MGKKIITHSNGVVETRETFYTEETVNQLKQQIEEKEKQIDIISRDNNSYKYNIDEQKRIIDDFAKQLKEKDNYHLRYELAGADETITNLKEQLAEKDIRIEELEGQFAYECECNKQLVELQKQLAEKQNTIDEINKEFVQAVHDWKTLCAEKDKEISKLQASCQQVKTQLAIQELEKVKDCCESYALELNKREDNKTNNEIIKYLYAITEIIDNQIQELKEMI